MGLPEEVKIPAPIKQKLHNIHSDIIRGKHKQAINAFKNTSSKRQYRFVDMPMVITLGKVKFALKSLSTKDTRRISQALADSRQDLTHDNTINMIDEDPAGKTCHTTYRSPVRNLTT
ncbi:MAG: hypothetical protein L3K24_14460 [Gammaproteobacteria bacterium]|nr:hypothetical protein [Gammaproteobacteria bacterium]